MGLTTTERRVLAAIDEDELVASTQALVRIPGGNPPGAEAATATALARLATDRGLRTELDEVAPGRPNVTITLPGGPGPGLLLLGHTDVVPPGDGWTADPFSGALRDGRIFGRGSADMRGGLIAALLAMHAVARAGVALSGPVELAATVDEEDLGLGIRRLLAARPGVRWAGCIVAEPTELQTVIAARGDSYLEYRVSGRAAHSGAPQDGRNAIVGAARIVGDLMAWHTELAGAPHPAVGPATVSVGTVVGGQGVSIVAAECRLGVDRRLLPGETGAQVLQTARDRLARLDLAAAELTAEVELTMQMPGFATAADNPVVTVLHDAVRAVGGPDRPLGGWTAACDGGFVAEGGTPVVVCGPGSVTAEAHRANESVAVADLVTAARAYAVAVLRLLG